MLQRAIKRTKFTGEVDVEALREYAQLNINAGYSRKLPDFDSLVDLSVLRGLSAPQGQLPRNQAAKPLALGRK